MVLAGRRTAAVFGEERSDVAPTTRRELVPARAREQRANVGELGGRRDHHVHVQHELVAGHGRKAYDRGETVRLESARR